jgi:hypothetical protein
MQAISILRFQFSQLKAHLYIPASTFSLLERLMSIIVQHGGFCLDVECTAPDCLAFEGFGYPTLPPHTPVPPSQPLFACPEATSTGYIVT